MRLKGLVGSGQGWRYVCRGTVDSDSRGSTLLCLLLVASFMFDVYCG